MLHSQPICPDNAQVVLKPELMQVLRHEFALQWGGIHGAPHRAGVCFNGLRMARDNGARSDVAECFARLRNSLRIHEGNDAHHGARAADYVRPINQRSLHVDTAGLDQFIYACQFLSDGLIDTDITVKTFWNADRVELGA